MSEIVILGGPNGAGKTTAAKVLLPESLNFRAFLNAEEIARQLAAGDAEPMALRAGRLMLERMRELVQAKQNFAFETTCSGKSYSRMLRECQKVGWRV
jgi:predicted ABC-type ATPase